MGQTLHRTNAAPLPKSIQSLTAYNDQTPVHDIFTIHKLANLMPQYLLPKHYVRAIVVYAPCGVAFVDIQFNPFSLLSGIDQIQSRRFCAFNPKDGEIVENMIAKSKIYKLPPLSGSDVARVSGIQMKHNPMDLVKTAAVFAQKINLVAQFYAPSLIIDASLLGFNQFGLIADKNVLIYSLQPNPLYKQIKHQRRFKNELKVEQDGYQYLPLCAVLSANIATSQHYSFILRCSLGLNSIFGGNQNNFMKKMYRNLKLMNKQYMNTNSPLKNDSKDENFEIQKYNQTENEDDSLYAEDLEDDYYLHMRSQKQQNADLLELSPKRCMQNLPPIPSFIIIGKSGTIIRSIPSIYDEVPIKDIFLAMHIYSILDQNFGDAWKQPQIQIFNDYWRIEEQTFRITTIERAIREYISTGRIARRPPFPVSDYLPPNYGIKDGRYFESQSIFGISPHPISSDSTNMKVLNLQNVAATIERNMFYGHLISQHRLIIREILRRVIKNFESLNLGNKSDIEIQDKRSETLLIKVVYNLMCTIARPAQTIQNGIGMNLAKE
ncbi:MAG: hypothetical protein EZS28_032577, partial [Streblomastix strix]